MVSVLDEAVFVHVPKNGGSSVSLSFGGVDQFWPQHVPWRVLEDHVDGRPGFGLLRNPWHRMVSLYYFLLRSPMRHRQRVNPSELHRMGFKRWLLEGKTYMSNEPIDGQIWIRQNSKYLDVSPSNTYPGIEKLEHPVWGMPPMQRRPSMWWLDGLPKENIGRVETVNSDVQRISDRLGFKFKHIGRTNITRSKPKDWREEYDSETIDFVAHYHAADLEEGGYEFEPGKRG